MGFTLVTRDGLLALTAKSPTYDPILKFAITDEIGNNVEEDIWDYGGTMTRLGQAQTLNVVSSSASDNLVISVIGVDGDYNLISEPVQLDGTNPVTTSKEFFRVNRVEVPLTSPVVNQGNITLTGSISATVQGHIKSGVGQSEMTHYSVPTGYSILIKTAYMGVARNKDATVRFKVGFSGNEYRSSAVVNVNGAAMLDFTGQPVLISEKIDFKLTARAEVNNTIVSCNLVMLQIKTSDLVI